MRRNIIYKSFVLTLVVVGMFSCSGPSKLRHLQHGESSVGLTLSKESDAPELKYSVGKRDTIIIKDHDTGKDLILMKAMRDEDGEMVAHDQIDAAVITSRFRNVAERHGKIDIQFQIIVPEAMRDKAWQLRFHPDMYVMEDSTRLETVIVTGRNFRKNQLRGYEQYERFVQGIITDTTLMIDLVQLERFLQRNIPQVFMFKTDSTEVSDEEFYSYYGVSERQAVDHFTRKFLVQRNQWKINNKEKMFRRYVKNPFESEGIRLDTMLVDGNGDFVYNYTQTVLARPRLRRIDIVISGDVRDKDKILYKIPRTEPLSFYVSSVSSFVDLSEHYMTRVIERRAEANASYSIAFDAGRFDVRENFRDNANQIALVKENLSDLLANEVYDLDSIVVVANASPEGRWAFNEGLSKRRGQSVANYFDSYIRDVRKEISSGGFTVDESGKIIRAGQTKIRFTHRSVPENWSKLDYLVGEDNQMTDDEKDLYFSHSKERDKDRREELMRSESYYKYMSEMLYPKLRVVDFAFHLHRKGMIKDTIHTTELDANYMRGVQLLKDMEYDEAVKVLGPYQDYNAAVAYTGAMRNASAMLILKRLEPVAPVCYLKAIIYSRLGDDKSAIESYLDACRLEPNYVHRGNLDPEISALIKMYGLNKNDDDDLEEFSY